MTKDGYAFIVVLVAAACTLLTRAAPFLLFGRGKQTPPLVQYLGNVLPPAMIATLVIYCYKGTTLSALPGFAPQALAGLVVVVLHLWKRNTMLSVAGGTICYMLLIHTLFA